MTKKIPDRVTLNFQGVNLKPNKITDCLGVKPSLSEVAGRIIDLPSGKRLVTKNGGWVYDVNKRGRVEKQLTHLTNYFRNKKKQLKKIANWKSVDHAYIYILIDFVPGYVTHSALLKSDDVHFWSSCGIDICCVFSTMWCQDVLHKNPSDSQSRRRVASAKLKKPAKT